MGYLRSYQGDYMRSYVGDPFFHGKILGGIIKLGTKIFKRTPIGGVITGVAGALPSPRGVPGPPGVARMPTGGGRFGGPRMDGGGPRGTGVAPAGACAPSGYHLAKDGSGRFVRNRRMDMGNMKALARSGRRQRGFLKIAKKNMPPGYRVVTTSSRRSKK